MSEKNLTRQECVNIDIFTPDAGLFENCNCGICGSVMNVKRNLNGATSYIEAMAKTKHLHDYFSCPNREKDWHIQAKRILEVAQQTPSKITEDALIKEANDIVFHREATKKV